MLLSAHLSHTLPPMLFPAPGHRAGVIVFVPPLCSQDPRSTFRSLILY